MKIRTLALGTAGLALALTLAACSSTSTTSSSSASPAASSACQAVQKEYPKLVGTTITVATDPEIPSFSFIDSTKSNQVQGFNIDWTTAVTKCLGMKYKVLQTSFPGLIPALQAGRADTVNSNLVATTPRLAQVNFVTFQKQIEVFLVAAGNPKKITTANDLCGNSIAVVPSSLEQALAEQISTQCVAKGKSGVNISTYADLAGGTQAVLTGRSDVFMEPDSFAYAAVKQYKGKLTTSPRIPQGDTFIGWALVKNKTTLAKALLAASLVEQKNGEEAKLFTKWGQSVAYVAPAKLVTK